MTTPEGLTYGPVQAVVSAACEQMNRTGEVVGRVAYEIEPFPTARGVIKLMVHPNETFNRAEKRPALSPSGLWRVDVKPREIKADDHHEVQVWIARGKTLPCFPPLCRQAFLENSDYVRFNILGAPLAVDPCPDTSPVRRAGTLSGFAAGALVRMNGTSIASPEIARLMADAMAEAGPAQAHKVDREWVELTAKESDRHLPKPQPAKTRAGGGRLVTEFRFGPGGDAP